eukprot:m.45584 g.45584  ORF g.45584 m.45584 type:complete len:234 (-) comp10890_c0_seq2:103-804(-)
MFELTHYFVVAVNLLTCEVRDRAAAIMKVSGGVATSLALTWLCIVLVHGAELTTEVGPGATECFYEEAQKGQHLYFEYEVVYGGRLDIDVQIRFGQTELWSARRLKEEEHPFVAHETGTYEFCLDNSFSTMTAKTVSFEITIDNDQDEVEADKKPTAMTQIEESLKTMNGRMVACIEYQRRLRNRELSHRLTAKFMNSRVNWVSAAEAVTLVAVSVFQIMYLRSLFANKQARF